VGRAADRLAVLGNRLRAVPPAEALLLSVLFTVAVLARYAGRGFESSDYTLFLRPWHEQLRAGGGFRAVGRPIGNYYAPYLYLLAASTYLPLSALAAAEHDRGYPALRRLLD
jgi:hypothetical protein